MEKVDTEEGSVHSSGAVTAQTLTSGALSQSEPEKSSSSDASRLTDSKQEAGVARKRYTREDLLNARNSKLVRDSPISLESEIFRELQVDNFFEQNVQPSSARPIQGSQQIGPQDPPVWKDDSWRLGNRFKSPAIAGSPPTGLPPKSRLVDDGPLAGSPDKEKPPGATGPPGGMGPPQRGPSGPGWRRDWRNENEEGHEGWRPGSRQNSVLREEGQERGDRRSSVGTNDEGWRPPPPGLQGRTNSRGGSAGGGAPPGLGSNGEQWEKPWGAGRGRLLDGERRLTGKPRDPPGIMPPRENTREPGVKAQLPEGWNKPTNRDEWRNGAKGKVWEDKTAARQSFDGGNPSWMAVEPEEAEGDTPLLEQRRAEVEAERKAMQEERQAKMSAAKSDPGQDLLGDDEVEAMKLQQEEDERRERIAAEVIKTEPAKPPRPASAQAGSLDFNVDSLFAGTQNGPGSTAGRGEEAPDIGSRFGRWFQLESSPSAPTALPPAETQGQGLPQQGQATPAPQQAGEQSFLQQQQQPPSVGEATQIQQFLASQSQTPGQQQELPRGLLTQLQQGGGGASNGSLSSLGQGAGGANPQAQNPTAQNWPPRTLTDMERAMLERQLMSPQGTPRDAMGMPIQQQQSPQQAAQAQFGSNPNSALLQLLQGQQMRGGGLADPKMAQQREPTFANPNPQMTAQQQQQLMNSLSMAGQQGNQQQQQQQQQQMGANLLEQLQQLRFAQNQSNQLTQQQQAQLQAQQAREREQQQFAQLRQQLAMQQQQQQQQQGLQGQGQAQNPLLAAFSAQMPRETGLGVGRGDRPQGMNLGQQQQQQQQNNLAHLLQNPQFAHNLRQQAQASQAASNAYSGAPYGFSSAGGAQMGALGQNAGLNQYGARQAPQPSFATQGGPGMGSAEAHSVARYIEQQRALEAANHHAHQQKLLQQHRLFQMQQLAAQQQQREATQRAAAHAALLQQQQQQHAAGLGGGSRLTPAEAVLRQQQMLQFQALNLGGGNQARGAPQSDTDALARFLSQQGASGLNNLGGRPL